jgi:hypothetical protein
VIGVIVDRFGDLEGGEFIEGIRWVDLYDVIQGLVVPLFIDDVGEKELPSVSWNVSTHRCLDEVANR